MNTLKVNAAISLDQICNGRKKEEPWEDSQASNEDRFCQMEEDEDDKVEEQSDSSNIGAGDNKVDVADGNDEEKSERKHAMGREDDDEEVGEGEHAEEDEEVEDEQEQQKEQQEP